MKTLVSFIALLMFAIPARAEQVELLPLLNNLCCFDECPTGPDCPEVPECPECPWVEPCDPCFECPVCPGDYIGPRFVLYTDDFLDQETGLVWRRQIGRESFDSFDAYGYRLPTISELFSLLDWTKNNADYVEGAIFLVPAEFLLGGDPRFNRLGGPFLTSSPIPENPAVYWAIRGSGSFDNRVLPGSERWVLPVKIQ